MLFRKALAVALGLALVLALLQGCDATTGGLRQPPSSPFPYNSSYG